MIVRCEKCGSIYNDENRWTICPHGPLWARNQSYCRKCDMVHSTDGECFNKPEETVYIYSSVVELFLVSLLFLLSLSGFILFVVWLLF